MAAPRQHMRRNRRAKEAQRRGRVTYGVELENFDYTERP